MGVKRRVWFRLQRRDNPRVTTAVICVGTYIPVVVSPADTRDGYLWGVQVVKKHAKLRLSARV